MRAVALLLLLATVDVRGACIHAVEVAVGPQSVQPQCSYWSADIAAEGPLVVGAWVTSTVTGFPVARTTGSTAGGALDTRGRLRAATQTPLNESPGFPAVATNGQLSLLAWSRNGQGTFVRFLDAAGAPAGAIAQISTAGTMNDPPRPVWNGRDWIVVMNEEPHVVSFRIGADGTVLERVTIAENAKLSDAHGSLIVVERAAGYELITPAQRLPLPFIPAGSTVALDRSLLAWHGGAIGAVRLGSDGTPAGTPIAIANADPGIRNIAVAGDVVLWNDYTTVRGARLGTPVVMLAPREGRLHAATTTSEGAVALISGTCAVMQSYFLAPFATALEPVENVSRVAVGQSARAIVPTARGHHAYWSEGRPLEGGTQLFVTHLEGAGARPPVRLNAPGSAVGEVDVAPFGSGSVVAFAEYPEGHLPGFLRLARVDGNGAVSPAVTLGELHYLQGVAVTARGDTITVFSVEHATYAWIVDLWRSDIRPDGTVTRELLQANIDGFFVDAAATPAGPVVIWADNDGDSRDQRRLTVRENGRTRVFTMPAVVELHRAVDGESPMILRIVRTSLYAFFPDTGAEVLIAEDVGYGTPVNATPRADGTFDVAAGSSVIRTFHVTPQGTLTPGEELCFTSGAVALSMRAGVVDALLTTRGGGVFVAQRAPARRRAVR